jgi:hypothetical protein
MSLKDFKMGSLKNKLDTPKTEKTVKKATKVGKVIKVGKVKINK